jgi:hypothetical protein
MKLAITKKTSPRIFNRAPINFWEPDKVEEDSTTKNNFYQDSICHEVKYDPTNKKFDTIHCSVHDFLDVMECYQITDNIDPLLKPKDQSKTDKN